MTMITPKDIETKIFKKSALGYDKDEVDQFLDAIILDYEKLLQENQKNKEEIEKLKEKVDYYGSIERSLQSTLALGQKTADELVENATREKEKMEYEAKVEAERIRLESEALQRKYKQSTAELARNFNSVKARLKDMLSAEMRILDDFDVKAEEVVVSAEQAEKSLNAEKRGESAFAEMIESDEPKKSAEPEKSAEAESGAEETKSDD